MNFLRTDVVLFVRTFKFKKNNTFINQIRIGLLAKNQLYFKFDLSGIDFKLL